MLPEPIHGSSLSNIIALQVYVRENLESWYRFVRNTLGRDVGNGDLRLVHSCRKSAGYGIATVSKGGDLPITELTFLVDSSWQGESGCKYMWRHKGYAQVKTGPMVTTGSNFRASEGEILPVNQCLFIGTIDCRLQADIWNNLAGPSAMTVNPHGSSSKQPLIQSQKPSPVSRSEGGRNDHLDASSSLTTQRMESPSGIPNAAHINKQVNKL